MTAKQPTRTTGIAALTLSALALGASAASAKDAHPPAVGNAAPARLADADPPSTLFGLLPTGFAPPADACLALGALAAMGLLARRRGLG